MLVKVGGGALRLAVAGDVVQLCVSGWLLPVDSTAIVLCVEGLITCVLAGNCQWRAMSGWLSWLWVSLCAASTSVLNVRLAAPSVGKLLASA